MDLYEAKEEKSNGEEDVQIVYSVRVNPILTHVNNRLNKAMFLATLLVTLISL